MVACRSSKPRVVCRKVEAKWSSASADGRKWFESQCYSKRAGNRFKGLKGGDLVFFGPSRSANRLEGVALVSGPPVTGLTPQDALEVLRPRLSSPALHSDLVGYLRGGTSVDYVAFDRVWDVRELGLTFKEACERIGAGPPGAWQGLPALQPQPDAARLDAFLRSPKVVVRHTGAPPLCDR